MRMSRRCRNCQAELGSHPLERTWEAICPDCGQLSWLQAGDVVTCRVTRVTPFGVIVELGNGIEGLIHVSELSWQQVRHPSEIVSAGADLEARVLMIDVDEKKIGLSCKRVHPRPTGW